MSEFIFLRKPVNDVINSKCPYTMQFISNNKETQKYEDYNSHHEVCKLPNKGPSSTQLNMWNYKTCAPCMSQKPIFKRVPSRKWGSWHNDFIEGIDTIGTKLKPKLKGNYPETVEFNNRRWEVLLSLPSSGEREGVSLMEKNEQDEELKIPRFLDNCCEQNFVETSRDCKHKLLLRYFLKKESKPPKVSPLLLEKKKRDLEIAKRMEETPLQIFIRTMSTITKLLKHAIWRKKRFGEQFRLRFNMTEDMVNLGEHKGGYMYAEPLEERDRTLKRLRKGYRNSKTEEVLMLELKSAAIKKRHMDTWTKRVKEEKMLEQSLKKKETVSKKFGEKLSHLNRKEDKMLNNLQYFKEKDNFLADLFSIHQMQRFLPKVQRCFEDDFGGRSVMMLQEIQPSQAFETLKYVPGKRLCEIQVPDPNDFKFNNTGKITAWKDLNLE